MARSREYRCRAKSTARWLKEDDIRRHSASSIGGERKKGTGKEREKHRRRSRMGGERNSQKERAGKRKTPDKNDAYDSPASARSSARSRSASTMANLRATCINDTHIHGFLTCVPSCHRLDASENLRRRRDDQTAASRRRRNRD